MSSNLKRKYAVVGFSSMLLLSSFFTYSSVYQLMHWPNLLDPRDNRWNLTAEDNWMSYRFYMDELERHEKKASGPVIQSELIKDEFLKVFIPYNKSFDDFDLDDGEYIVSLFRLSIDDVVLDEVSWYSYRAPENDQLGMRTLIDISDLQKGHYRLRVFDTNKRFEEVIPFWKE
jgi:hypothetical protein